MAVDTVTSAAAVSPGLAAAPGTGGGAVAARVRKVASAVARRSDEGARRSVAKDSSSSLRARAEAAEAARDARKAAAATGRRTDAKVDAGPEAETKARAAAAASAAAAKAI
jgi:hypothetical protein